MSEPEEELETQALQRELDDAFATTRPRPAFEDELWLRMQSSRPAPTRLRDAIAGFLQGIREVPAVPAAAVAALLVVVIGVGTVALSGLGRGGGGASTASQYNGAEPNQLTAGTFGRLPTPVFNSTSKGATAPNATAGGQADLGAAQLTWTGKLDLAISSAPVFRYREPTTNEADQFASALGAVLRDRPSGFLGMYTATDYTLKVRGTVQSPPSSPAYFIFAAATMPPVEAAGAGPQDLADIFLAQHSLSPQWNYTVTVDSSSDPVRVRYERQFVAPGYGTAYLVDVNGNRYGLEVDLSANRPVVASGLLPANLDQADYKIVTAEEAIRSALASSVPAPAVSGAAVPAIQLNKAELVYVLVPAGDHSFYEPAFLFSGQYQLNGQTLTRRVLVPAVVPSQRNP
ncbi:MAG: hypothetical protein E6J20_10835 [Chloroflexi bacterium]|nr:MAG: hypothetical protein E6J20_10835 [Chloroflexota bacterium]